MTFLALGAAIGFVAGVSPGPVLTLVVSETLKAGGCATRVTRKVHPRVRRRPDARGLSLASNVRWWWTAHPLDWPPDHWVDRWPDAARSHPRRSSRVRRTGAVGSAADRGCRDRSRLAFGADRCQPASTLIRGGCWPAGGVAKRGRGRRCVDPLSITGRRLGGLHRKRVG